MEIDDFEQELRKALTRQTPRADFTNRVLRRIEEPQSHSAASALLKTLTVLLHWRLIPVLASALVLGAGGLYWRHEYIVHGQQAKQKLLVAMHIAGAELNETRQ